MKATFVKLLPAEKPEQIFGLFNVRLRAADDEYLRTYPDLQIVRAGLKSHAPSVFYTFVAVIMTPSRRQVVPATLSFLHRDGAANRTGVSPPKGVHHPKFGAVLYQDDGETPLSEFLGHVGIVLERDFVYDILARISLRLADRLRPLKPSLFDTAVLAARMGKAEKTANNSPEATPGQRLPGSPSPSSGAPQL